LYDLAIRPEYLDELRKEAESAIQGHGWTKAAMQKLRKLDSFMKESVRMNPVGSRASFCPHITFWMRCSFCFPLVVLMRKTLKDWTTSDGTLIPAGNFIAVASSAVAQSKVCILFVPNVLMSYVLSSYPK
jgi:cytochrome P450